MRLRRLAVPCVLTTLLAACSGGSGQTNPAAAPSPPPPPAQQTLANSPTGTTFTGSSGQELEAYTWFNSIHPGAYELTRLDTTVQVEMVANGIALRLPGFNAATIDLSASSSQRTSERVYSTGTTLGGTITFLDGPKLTYSTYGVWNVQDRSSGHRNGQTGAMAYGIETPTLPTTGVAQFTGAASGVVFAQETELEVPNGTVRLEADFARGTVTGVVQNLIAEDATRFADIHLDGGRITGTGFAGTTRLGTNSTRLLFDFTQSASGTFGGEFYGPGAVEAAGSFNLYGPPHLGFTGWRPVFVGAFTASSDPGAVITQPAPPTPAHFPTLAEAPSAGIYDYNHAVFAVSGPESNPAAASVFGGVVLHKTANGFTMRDFESDEVAFDTSANSPQRVASNQFLANGLTTISTPKSVQFLAAQALTYSTYGIWAYTPQGTNATAQPGLSPATRGGGVMAYGQRTTEARMPITGSARFTGKFGGFFAVPGAFGTITSGDAQLDVNFASTAVTGTIRNVMGIRGRTLNPTLESGRLNDIALTGNIRQTEYRGTASVLATAGVTYDLTGATGTLAGSFYGPDAAETAGVVSLTGTGTLLQGAFVAGK